MFLFLYVYGILVNRAIFDVNINIDFMVFFSNPLVLFGCFWIELYVNLFMCFWNCFLCYGINIMLFWYKYYNVVY